MLHVRWRLFHATEKINDFLVNYFVKRKNVNRSIVKKWQGSLELTLDRGYKY